MSRKSLGYLALCVGLVGVVGTSYLKAMSTLWDGLPGSGPGDHFADQHPLRWLIMNIGFWASAAAIVTGFFLVFRKKSLGSGGEP